MKLASIKSVFRFSLWRNQLQVFLEYSDTAGCTKAKSALSGRKFGGNTVTALYYPEDKYYGGDYAAWPFFSLAILVYLKQSLDVIVKIVHLV